MEESSAFNSYFIRQSWCTVFIVEREIVWAKYPQVRFELILRTSTHNKIVFTYLYHMCSYTHSFLEISIFNSHTLYQLILPKKDSVSIPPLKLLQLLLR